MSESRAFARHVIATIAYRGSKAVRGAPPEFADFKAGPTTRTPVEILAHIGDLLEISAARLHGPARWHDATALPWEREIARFHAMLAAVDAALVDERPIVVKLEPWFQGPIADALTHIGQLAMLRRLSGFPMKGEANLFAGIEPGRVGADQTPPDPTKEFD